jgi:hypothetical protein
MFLSLVLALAAVQPIDDFRAIRSFRCDLTESVGRSHLAEGKTENEKSSTLTGLVFDALNYTARTARFVGNAGAEDVTLIPGTLETTLLEVTASGNVALTTIFRAPRPARSVDTFHAVMSRHIALTSGAAVISQFYGTCKALR